MNHCGFLKDFELLKSNDRQIRVVPVDLLETESRPKRLCGVERRFLLDDDKHAISLHKKKLRRKDQIGLL